MKSPRSVVASLRQEEYLASVDIHDAYLHVPIYPPQHFLCFAVIDKHFCFVMLLFKLSSASRVFTKMFAAPLILLRIWNIQVIGYLDDLLLRDSSP